MIDKYHMKFYHHIVVIDHYQKLHDEFKQQFLDFAKLLGRLLRQ